MSKICDDLKDELAALESAYEIDHDPDVKEEIEYVTDRLYNRGCD